MKSLLFLCFALANGFQFQPEIAKSISKSVFLKGITPSSFIFYNRAAQYNTNDGISIGHCVHLRNVNSDASYIRYRYKGTFYSEPNLILVEKTTYDGHEFIVINKSNCKHYLLIGQPYRVRNKIVCFNEQQTTDRNDKLQIWNISSGGLSLSKTVRLSFDQLHLDGKQNIKFSKKFNYLYFKTVNNSYQSFKI